jgi:hypothetical protein
MKALLGHAITDSQASFNEIHLQNEFIQLQKTILSLILSIILNLVSLCKFLDIVLTMLLNIVSGMHQEDISKPLYTHTISRIYDIPTELIIFFFDVKRSILNKRVVGLKFLQAHLQLIIVALPL